MHRIILLNWISRITFFAVLGLGMASCNNTPTLIIPKEPTERCNTMDVAAAAGDIEAVAYWLDIEKVDVNKKYDTNLATKGWTALHLAAANNQEVVVSFLLSKGADKEATCGGGEFEGWRPLHLAAHRGHWIVVDILLKKGAKADAPCKAGSYVGYTPLHLAAQGGHRTVVLSLVEQLLQKGATLDITCQAGKRSDITSLILAARYGRLG